MLFSALNMILRDTIESENDNASRENIDYSMSNNKLGVYLFFMRSQKLFRWNMPIFDIR